MCILKVEKKKRKYTILSISKDALRERNLKRLFDTLEKQKVGFTFAFKEEHIMNKRKLLALVLTGVMAISTLAGCGSSDTKTSDTDVKTSETAETSDKNVLRVGMECAYAPFNWTQDSDTTPDGSKAVPIYGSDYYAYGYDVAVAQKLADEMGMDLEVHKVEWSSIGISLDAGDYDVIIAGMGKTAEREASYSFTEPYYYRDNCIVVKREVLMKM